MSKKEYACIAGIVIFIVITSFKFGNDYSVYGLKKPLSLSYSNGILYVVQKDGYISMLDKYGHILELEFLDLNDPSSILTYQNMIVVSTKDNLFFYQRSSKLLKVVKFSGKIRQIANFGNDILVLLDTGDILKVQNYKVKFLFNIKGASSIATNDNEIFVVVGHSIKSYNINKQVLTSKDFSVPIDYISFNNGYLSVTSQQVNRVFILNKDLMLVKSFKFEKPTFAYYSNQKLFVCSSDLDKIYIRNN
ncbi:MAG: hypothetical protein ACPLW6_00415 [Desulfurella sp.]|jgi:hypothetical protein|uniref:Uncharacterized protein n=3 Tax=Desulfurella multipotens TaxID=79269 RepID=A0A1G6IRP3_9BACT|nr:MULTISPECIES: hypothetical protein [Desulfurella]PMP93697.1 MAG: hypothetical protein C0173_00140 [Desulfurella sp.]SDC09167.1 hypothetical protein SAMN05660835_00296 [Desulfurella multipotens]HEX13134.1 hypothetical protein [Desulfurella acetivorans]